MRVDFRGNSHGRQDRIIEIQFARPHDLKRLLTFLLDRSGESFQTVRSAILAIHDDDPSDRRASLLRENPIDRNSATWLTQHPSFTGVSVRGVFLPV